MFEGLKRAHTENKIFTLITKAVQIFQEIKENMCL